MPVQEFLFTVDPRTDKNLSSINEQLRSLTNREDPLTLDNFISFDVIGYSGLRSVVIRVTMEVNAFYARTTFPVNGAAFSQTAAPQAIKLVFNSKVDEGSITDTSIKYNGASVIASNITLESDGYTLSVSTSSLSHDALKTHTIELISLQDRKGNELSKQDVFSYVVGTSGSAASDRGNPEPYTYHDKVGDFKVTSFVIDRYAKIADKITEYLKTNNIDRNSVIAQDILNVNEHTLEVYILYFSDLFPSVIRTFPQEGALVSSDGVPTEAVITFSQPTHINITEANNITLDGIDLSASGTLSNDNRTLRVNVNGKVTGGSHFLKVENLYNELGRVRPSPPIAIGFTAADIADNGGAGSGTGTGTPAISGIVLDVGTQIDGVNNPLITLGGDTFITSSGVSASEIALVFDETQINHANIQGGNFTAPADISPSVTNQFISAISFNTHGHVASVVRSGVVPASIDHGSLDGLSDNDHPQYFTTSSFNTAGIVISDGDGTITINAADAVNIGQWNTAYSWGNHGTIGYLTTHPTISAASNTTNSNPSFIQNLTFDTSGHVLTVSSVSVTPVIIGAVSTAVFNAASNTEIVKSDGAGSVTFITDASPNWNTAYTHSQLSNQNPHGVSIGNIVAGTFAQLDTAITNVDLVKSGDNVSVFVNNQGYLQDSEFASQGIMLRGASEGTYSILTDNSPNWNTAYTHISATNNPHNVTASQAGAVDTDTYSSVGIVISDGDGTATINAANGTNIGQWNTAYGWGNHGTIGYLTTFTETDPVFSAHIASDITNTDTTNWTTAYGWGDHGSGGYLTAEINDLSTSVTWANVPDANITESSVTQHSTALQ
ncbi:hypothetical protein N8457_00535, partial [bacterium]|nr:hypothetical protein [bacterium]